MKACSLLYKEGHYVLPPLPYTADALEPFLDAETVALHHDQHQAAYVAGANAAAERLRAVALGEKPEGEARCAAEDLSFNLAGSVLHRLYWHSITPEPGTTPEGALADALNKAFGSMEGFLRVFRGVALGVQGSGWAVLGADRVSGRLGVFALQRHENGWVPRLLPLLVCDVWEHAYYLRYRNNRAGYVAAFAAHMNWKGAAERYERLSPAACHVR